MTITDDLAQLAVIEGKWWDDTNLSVRPMFEIISGMAYQNPDRFHYEMFCDGHALDNIARRLAQKPSLRYAYIAAHGSHAGICGSDGVVIGRTKILNYFSGHAGDGSRKFDGIFFGACSFLDRANAQHLLWHHGTYGKTECIWVAGYNQDIDWIDSTALDMIFWAHFLSDEDGGGPIARIRRIARKINVHCSSLVEALGLEIYVRKPGPVTGEIIGLLGRGPDDAFK